jgi:enoyl-CoA hydratase/carnithine racemase
LNYSVIIVENKGLAVWITLNRPHHKNAYVTQTFRELLAALDDIEKQPEVVAVVIKGAGDSFCSGADLKDFATDFQGRLDFELLCDRVFERIENLGKVTIAMIQGYAMAGGFELAQICDLIIADENCKIGDGHKGYSIPTMGCTQRLPRLIGARKAKEILYTGDLMSGKEAERIGLVNQAVPADKMETTVEALIAKLAKKPVATLAIMKSLVNYSQDADLTKGLQHERIVVRSYIQQCRDTEGK